MSTAEMIAEQVKTLPPARQQEVLNLVRQLNRASAPTPRHDPYGILRGVIGDISAEDIAEARREMWGKFGDKDV